MKKLLFCLAVTCLGAPASQAQWTPGSGVITTTNLVGIGTTTPLSKLDVYMPPSSTLQQGLFLHSGSFGIGSNAQASYFIKTQDDGNGATQFIVHGDGATGIGMDAVAGYKLAINGAAICLKMVVKQMPWPDYVFDSTYQLQPLKNVEKYINDHHRLPGIPSADSVAAAGIDVGANQAALLKKVEELTLYIIEQNKKIDALAQQNKQLGKLARRIKQLEKQKK